MILVLPKFMFLTSLNNLNFKTHMKTMGISQIYDKPIKKEDLISIIQKFA